MASDAGERPVRRALLVGRGPDRMGLKAVLQQHASFDEYHEAPSLEQAREKFEAREHADEGRFHLLLVSAQAGRPEDLEAFIRRMRKKNPYLPIVLAGAREDVEAVTGLKNVPYFARLHSFKNGADVRHALSQAYGQLDFMGIGQQQPPEPFRKRFARAGKILTGRILVETEFVGGEKKKLNRFTAARKALAGKLKRREK